MVRNKSLFFWVKIVMLCTFSLMGNEIVRALPSSVIPEKEDAGCVKNGMMRSSRLKSGVVVIENLKYPHENLDLVTRNYFLSCHFEPDNNWSISVGRSTEQRMFSFTAYSGKMTSFCKYWFTFNDFSVIDYDGDGLADVRHYPLAGKYEIRLNDEWTPCREIRLKECYAIAWDGAVYKFERGKWRTENFVKTE